MKKILITLIIISICFCLGFCTNSLYINNFQFILDFSYLFNDKTFIYAGIYLLLCFIIYFNKVYKSLSKKYAKKLIQIKESDKYVLAGLEESHFQTDLELKENFDIYPFESLGSVKSDGVPIKSEMIGKKMDICLSKPNHTLVIGTTGSGKTTTFVNPAIQILSNLNTKPSLVISDPKGELYSLHYNNLKKQGYTVKVIDLRNPYQSCRWNPLEKSYLMYARMRNLKDEVEVDNEKGLFIFNNQYIQTIEEKDIAVKIKEQEIYDEIYEDLNDIATVLCPVNNKSEPIWECGAKNFILAILLGMLEDSAIPELGMTKDKFNFYNLMKIATMTDNDCAELSKFFMKRSPISKAVSLSKQVLDASEKTRNSYLSTIFDKLSIFSDRSICALTSSNEIDFESMDETPTALFLQIPDEKETRHSLASMIILQAYKGLVKKSTSYKNLSLLRSVYFVLDEFGNLPKIHKLEQMITVGRSRKIWLLLVVQSYSQLNKVYDDKSASIIKSNCNIKIFIGTTDADTINEFSKQCGNYTILQRNVSSNTKSSNDVNSSSSARERPLIYPIELAQLNNQNNMGNAIVSVFGFPPIKSKFTPSFLCNKYDLSIYNQGSEIGSPFYEEDVLFDLTVRNTKIFKKVRVKNQKELKEIDDLKQPLKMEITRLPIDFILDIDKKEILDIIESGKGSNIKNLIERKTEHLILEQNDMQYKLDTIYKLLEEIIKLEEKFEN